MRTSYPVQRMRGFTGFLERIYIVPELSRSLADKPFENLCKVAGSGEPAIGSNFTDVFFLGILHHDGRLIDTVCIEVLQEVQSGDLLEKTTEMAF